MMQFNHPSISFSAQRGSVLFVSIIMLVIITILSLAAMRSTMMQERMSGNLRDKNIAFQSAEIALRFAERELEAGAAYVVGTDSGFYEPDNSGGAAPDPADATVWEDSSKLMVTAPKLKKPAGASDVPQLFIEKLPASVPLIPGEPVKTDQFRISARGTGGSGKTNVVLQSYFVRYR